MSNVPINDPNLLKMTPELLDLIEMLWICDDPERRRRIENVIYDPEYEKAEKQAESEDKNIDKIEYTKEDKEKARKVLEELKNRNKKIEVAEEKTFDIIPDVPDDFEEVE